MSSEDKSLVWLIVFLLACAATLGVVCVLAKLFMPRPSDERTVVKY